jgi:hypothetical protein
MSWTFIVVTVFIVVVAILAKLYLKKEDKHTDYPYRNAGALFSPAERSFYGVLNQVVRENHEKTYNSDTVYGNTPNATI